MVTIIVAADGSFKLPQVDGRTSLRDALSILGSVRWAAGWVEVGGRAGGPAGWLAGWLHSFELCMVACL